MNFVKHKTEVAAAGFAVLENVYTEKDIVSLITIIKEADSSKPAFRKSSEVFAIRQFLKEIPEAASVIFNNNFMSIIEGVFGIDYFIVKAIYFDKPEASNWFVSYHQDLTISVDRKTELPGFGSWTTKQNQFAVQPPTLVLENIFTVRIHLDDTDENNGALKVIPGSHLKGIIRSEEFNLNPESVCSVSRGSVMLMKPLLLHSSGRTINNRKRRVIHLEFSNLELPIGLNWAERFNIQVAE